METREIELNTISVSDFNTRKNLEAGTEDTSLDDLANSIRERGLLNPITVRIRPNGRYDLIAGQRRFLACRKLGMATIPAIVRDNIDDIDATVISLVENLHRADMSPMDKARAFQEIYSKYGDYKRIAKETGVSIPTVRRYLSLLKLTPSIQDKLTTSEGPTGVGALSKLAETFHPEQQEDVLREIGRFKGRDQEEILKRSGGDLDKIPELTGQALEGAFSIRRCQEGLCFDMPEEWKSEIKRLLSEDNQPQHLQVQP